jgi:hypothetical protein
MMVIKCDFCHSELYDDDRVFYISSGYVADDITDHQRLLLFCKGCFAKILMPNLRKVTEDK